LNFICETSFDERVFEFFGEPTRWNKARSVRVRAGESLGSTIGNSKDFVTLLPVKIA